MLLNESSILFCPSLNYSSSACITKSDSTTKASIQIKSSLQHCFDDTTKLSFSTNNDKVNKNNVMSRKTCGKLSVLYNGYHSMPSLIYPREYDQLPQEMPHPYFRSLQHPLESQLQLLDAEEYLDDDSGIGILDFFQGKNIFVTGATGLVGKAFVEKLLRSTSVGKIYLLMRGGDEEVALDRLTKEIIDSDLFMCLRGKHGDDYEAFLREKLIAVAGNICEPNLGMDAKSAQEIMKNVDVIVDSAASTNLYERYDSLIDLNINATQRLMRFAKTCENLKLFVHISTAYVCGKKEGLISEKPLVMGQNGRNIIEEHLNDISFTRLDLADEISLAMNSFKESSPDFDASRYLKQLGQERADFFGFYNAYHMTKALSEMVLDEIRGDVPVLIIRPSVIESTYKDPVPGWIQGNRCFDPVIIAYGKGQLPAFLADPEEHMDIIPLDYVVNSTIASIAKHGMEYRSQLNVYHVGSGVANPLRFSEFFEVLHEYFSSKPLTCKDDQNIEKIKLFDNFEEFSDYTRSEIRRKSGMSDDIDKDETLSRKIYKQTRAKIAYAEQVCKLYDFIGFMKGRFSTRNTKRLLEEMSEEEKLNFEIDVTNIDWRKYFMESHIPGLEKHVLNRTRTSA